MSIAGDESLLRFCCVWFAFACYSVSMKVNPVINSMFILRSQAEYSTTAEMVVLRYILERPATGQRCGFTDIDALLAALRSELLAVKKQIISPAQEKGNL